MSDPRQPSGRAVQRAGGAESPGLALFDVDGTLLPKPSCERRFIAHLVGQGVLGPRQYAAAAAFVPRYLARFGKGVLRKNKAYLAGLTLPEVATVAQAFVGQSLVPQVFPGVLAALRARQQRGDRVVLLTGAPEFLAGPLARALGVAEVVATRCRLADGRFTGRPPLRHPYGEEKRRLAQCLAAESGIELSQSSAWADDPSDAPLLMAVGNAVVVNPGRQLQRLARENNWQILATEKAVEIGPA